MSTPEIVLIAAVANNGVIGNGDTMPWHLPEDLKHFKAVTFGKPVVMGRKTYESLGSRPLPGRLNVVVSSSYPSFVEVPLAMERTRLVMSYSLANALRYARSCCRPGEDVFVIGGGEIYAQTIGLADRLIISHLSNPGEGETRFPDIDPTVFAKGLIQPYPAAKIPFDVITYHRIAPKEGREVHG